MHLVWDYFMSSREVGGHITTIDNNLHGDSVKNWTTCAMGTGHTKLNAWLECLCVACYIPGILKLFLDVRTSTTKTTRAVVCTWYRVYSCKKNACAAALLLTAGNTCHAMLRVVRLQTSPCPALHCLALHASPNPTPMYILVGCLSCFIWLLALRVP